MKRKLNNWKYKKAGDTLFWDKGDKHISVSQSLGDKRWFTFIDGGKNIPKARIEYAQNKQEAISYAKSYMNKRPPIKRSCGLKTPFKKPVYKSIP